MTEYTPYDGEFNAPRPADDARRREAQRRSEVDAGMAAIERAERDYLGGSRPARHRRIIEALLAEGWRPPAHE